MRSVSGRILNFKEIYSSVKLLNLQIIIIVLEYRTISTVEII